MPLIRCVLKQRAAPRCSTCFLQAGSPRRRRHGCRPGWTMLPPERRCPACRARRREHSVIQGIPIDVDAAANWVARTLAMPFATWTSLPASRHGSNSPPVPLCTCAALEFRLAGFYAPWPYSCSAITPCRPAAPCVSQGLSRPAHLPQQGAAPAATSKPPPVARARPRLPVSRLPAQHWAYVVCGTERCSTHAAAAGLQPPAKHLPPEVLAPKHSLNSMVAGNRLHQVLLCCSCCCTAADLSCMSGALPLDCKPLPLLLDGRCQPP